MSLREEIINHLGKNWLDPETDDPQDITDEILEIIKKRIDELRQNYPKLTETEQPSNLLYNQLLGIDQFYSQVKEMLK